MSTKLKSILKTKLMAKQHAFFPDQRGEISLDFVPLDDRDANPAITETISAIVSGSRLVIVRILLDGPKGFNELMRLSGFNSKTLSSTLKCLRDKGIVAREVVSVNPFSVRYSLSVPGRDMEPILMAIENRGRKWLLKLQE